MEIKELYSIFCQCGCVATDSRKISGGELFIALKGENFDGNEYAEKALNSGAAYVVVTSGSVVCDKSSAYLDSDGHSRIIPVSDTLQTLQELARYHREHVLPDGKHLDIIGITGTNGKTTTKELIKTVLSVKYNVVATEGNLNNDIGVPLSLLKITPSTELAVIEMGASHPDDIFKLVRVSEPDFGIITNVGKAHLQGFGSFEGVKKAKGCLYDYVNAFGTSIFVNADDPVLMSMTEERNCKSVISYGLHHDGCVIMDTTPEEPFLRIMMPGGVVVKTKLVGAYNSANVLAALCIGKHFGVSEEEAISAIESYTPSNSRSQMVKTEHNVLVVDAYNANPSSMAAALNNFSGMKAAHKAALLGDMRELGPTSVSEHIAIVELAMKSGMDVICFVGEEFGKSLTQIGIVPAENSGIRWYETSEELADALAKKPLHGYAILVKGSRGIMMEKAIPAL